MAQARKSDPLVGFHYAIEVQGVVSGFFTECGGLGSEHEVIEHKVVDSKGREVIQKIPGRMKWQDITLKRGITDQMDIWKWRKMVEDGDMENARKNGSVVMFDNAYQEVARWDFERGWPLKVTGPQLQSDSNAFGVEELVITHEGLTRKN
ncbi:MAG: phage tail protein [Chloroflexota bacterium]|nr:phage tail protein [Chloroflexota bacterium]